MVVLPEVQQFANDLRRAGARRPVRRPCSVAQARLAVFGKPAFPLVEGLEMPKCRHVRATLRGARPPAATP
jgi:hypothetical protein